MSKDLIAKLEDIKNLSYYSDILALPKLVSEVIEIVRQHKEPQPASEPIIDGYPLYSGLPGADNKPDTLNQLPNEAYRKYMLSVNGKELDNCPFCGTGQPRLHVEKDNHEYYPWLIHGCPHTCPCAYGARGKTKEEVINAWNTRAPGSGEIPVVPEDEPLRQIIQMKIDDECYVEGNMYPVEGQYDASVEIMRVIEPFLMRELKEPQTMAEELAGALEHYANKTIDRMVGCPGRHTDYSSMIDSPTCPLCGENEDTRGGEIRQTIPDPKGEIARQALAKYREGREG